MSKVRIESLDYLRGLMAFSVMLYHYCYWSGIVLDSETILGKLGVYAVSIFYILSGLSLAFVYKNKINSPKDVFKFWIKRFFRIAPLFWIVVTLVILHSLMISIFRGVDFDIDAYTIFINYTFIFSFVKPDAAIPTGGWSIGNEIFFYTILPFVIFLQRKYRITIFIVLLVSFLFFYLFSYFGFDKGVPLSNQWGMYVNPLNQIFIFFAGVAIGYSKFNLMNKALGLVIICFLVFLFVMYPVAGDLVQVVSGFQRLFFTFLACMLVFVVFKCNPLLKGFLHRFFVFMGESCYSIYLLHPITSIPVVMVGNRLGLELVYSYFLAIVFTLIVCRFSYKFIEQPSIELGNRIVKKSSYA